MWFTAPLVSSSKVTRASRIPAACASRFASATLVPRCIPSTWVHSSHTRSYDSSTREPADTA